MNFTKTLIAVAATVASIGAHAGINATTAASSGSFLSLSAGAPVLGVNTGTLKTSGGATVASVVGGSILTQDFSYADIQAFGTPAGGTYLAVGPTAGTQFPLTSTYSSVVAFSAPTSFVSFLWGSPDTYNSLTVTTSFGAVKTYVPGSTGATGGLTFNSTAGSQSYAQYVDFSTTNVGETITSLTFQSNQNAFEAANFSITPVPEPETYALMLGGLGVLGFVARRRRSV